MRRNAINAMTAAALMLGLAACAQDRGGLAAPPRAKPDQVSVTVVDRAARGATLTRARVSTKSGDILILEPDGSVSEVALDSPEGRGAFEVTEAELAELEVNLGLDLAAADIGDFEVVPEAPRPPTAQEKALEAFAARTQPALPRFPAGFKADPAQFAGARVDSIKGDRKGELIEVTANLRAGVDADVAFAYATCALAGWAKGNGKAYARHIRTLQEKRGGKLLIGSAFILSDRRPMGLRVMETDDTLRVCKDRGIPAA